MKRNRGDKDHGVLSHMQRHDQRNYMTLYMELTGITLALESFKHIKK
jgi:hypothetical protein